jgi:ferric-dicitrate binding protein FerR (iron transport regulator)
MSAPSAELTAAEQQALWDPGAPGAEAVDRLAQRLAPLRAPPLRPLELPPRRERQDESIRPLVALITALAAVAALAWLVRGDAGDEADIARAPALEPFVDPLGPVHRVEAADPVEGPPAWRVAELRGEPQCDDPAVRAEQPLPDGTRVHTGPDASVLLERGAARAEVHPNSDVGREGEVLDLAHGRAWIELPRRGDGQRWRVRVGGGVVESRAVRFTAWADATGAGVDIVEGGVQLSATAADAPRVEGRAGQVCRAAAIPAPMSGVGTWTCADR